MSHFISVKIAAEFIARFRTNHEVILKEQYKAQAILATSETFDRTAFDALLSQPGCTAIRLYYGMDAGLKIHTIAVGVDSKNQDILTASLPLDAVAVIIENASRCPPTCPPPSPINP